MTGELCPKCGFPQAGAPDCARCGVVFARYQAPRPAEERAPDRAPLVLQEDEEGEKPSLFWRFYRVFRWVTLTACVVLIVLILRQSPPPKLARDPEAPERLTRKLRALDEARAQSQPAALALDEGELNSWVAQNVGLARASSVSPVLDLEAPTDRTVEEVRTNVRDLQIDLEGDLIRAYVVFDFHGKDLSLFLEGTLRAEDGYLRFVPTAGKLGSLPLAQMTLDKAVARLYDAAENREQFRLPPDVADIRVRDGHLVFTYR